MNVAVLSKEETNVQRLEAALSTEAIKPGRLAEAQVAWSLSPVEHRLTILKATRHRLSLLTHSLSQAISSELARTAADTRVAEILPLLAACRFLEQQAESILRVRKLGRRGLPVWLTGVESEVQRVPLGSVLVIGPANYPLFIPGTQVLQALAAGNSVTWKPGRGGRAVAELFAQTMSEAGLPSGLLRVTDDTVAATTAALENLPDKVFFTGSAATGRILMRQLAGTLTPCVMELSGSDAVIVLPSADLPRVVQALAFGMRLNGSATCMAPRRILLVDCTSDRRSHFISLLNKALAEVESIWIADAVRQQLRELLAEAAQNGASVMGDVEARIIRPILVLGSNTGMRIVQEDIFAPVLSVIDVKGSAGVLTAQHTCPFALTAAIFGKEDEARRLAATLIAGSVLINDLIVPTADPRLPFGGRRQSGFGVTRGAEGLLEMTAVKTIAVRKNRSIRHYERTTSAHESLFDGFILATHAGRWSERWRGVRQTLTAGKSLSSRKGIGRHGK